MDEATEIAVLGSVLNNLHVITQKIGGYSGISEGNVHCILECHNSYPYHISLQ
jgi:hypothetical protein